MQRASTFSRRFLIHVMIDCRDWFSVLHSSAFLGYREIRDVITFTSERLKNFIMRNRNTAVAGR